MKDFTIMERVLVQLNASSGISLGNLPRWMGSIEHLMRGWVPLCKGRALSCRTLSELTLGLTFPNPLASYSHRYILQDKLLNNFIKFQK